MKRLQWLLIAGASISFAWLCTEGAARAQGMGGRGCGASSGRTSSLQRTGPATLGTLGNATYQSGFNTLSSDLTAAVANRELTSLQARQLYRDVTAVLNGWPNQQLALAALQADLGALRTATRLTAQDAQTITSDITTVIQVALPNVQLSANLTTR